MKQQNQCVTKTQPGLSNRRENFIVQPNSHFHPPPPRPTQTTMPPSVNQLIKLPKLTLPEFSGNPLKWPERSSLFPATVDKAGIDDSLKMNHPKTLVTPKAKAAIAVMGFSGEMYRLAWETLSRNFVRTLIILNAQLKQIHAHQFIKQHDSQAIIKYSQTVLMCKHNIIV